MHEKDVVGIVTFDLIGLLATSHVIAYPGRGTPIHYLYRYVPPNGVAILKLLI